MAKESREAKRARKAAAKAAARTRAARITAGEIPEYLRQPSAVVRQPPPAKPRHKVVQALPEPPTKALIPPTDTELRPRDREQYADNAPPVWVRGEHHAEDD
ncbi:hypothetical protein GCM10010276_87650 [Streptomyces longisporus]|uniref:Uncharacterized protein n=1 Tax=Streptomyces longisporus TaxID=1948 RepID=A0ABP6ATA9_STRLO